MSRHKPQTSPTRPPWEPRTATRVGLSAALVSAAVGILFAVLQAQGWTVPRPLGIAIVVLLGIVIIAAAAVFVFEVARATRHFVEHRATTPSWIPREAPGLLDYEADARRSERRYVRVLNRVSRRNNRLSRRMTRYAWVFATLRNIVGPRVRQLLANRLARRINNQGAYTERRVELLKALVSDLDRNYRGMIAIQPLQTDEDVQRMQSDRDSLERNRIVSGSAAQSTLGYQKVVRETVHINISRSISIASRRLEEGLGGMVEMLHKQEKSVAALVSEYDRRLAQVSKEKK